MYLELGLLQFPLIAPFTVDGVPVPADFLRRSAACCWVSKDREVPEALVVKLGPSSSKIHQRQNWKALSPSRVHLWLPKHRGWPSIGCKELITIALRYGSSGDDPFIRSGELEV